LRCTVGHCVSHCCAGASVLNSAVTSSDGVSAMLMTALIAAGIGMP